MNNQQPYLLPWPQAFPGLAPGLHTPLPAGLPLPQVGSQLGKLAGLAGQQQYPAMHQQQHLVTMAGGLAGLGGLQTAQLPGLPAQLQGFPLVSPSLSPCYSMPNLASQPVLTGPATSLPKLFLPTIKVGKLF